MSWILLRQDPAIQTMRVSLPGALIIGFLMRLILDSDPTGATPSADLLQSEWFIFSFVVMSFCALMFMITGNIATHCSRMSMSLPLPPRHLWSMRILALLGAGLLPLLVATLTLAVRAPGQTGVPLVDPALLAMGLHACAWLALVAMVFQTPSPHLQQIKGGRGYVLFVILVAGGAFAAALLTAESALARIVPALLALILGIRIYLLLPRSFVLVSLRPEESGSREGDGWREQASAGVVDWDSAGSTVAAAMPTRLWLHFTVWRTLMNHFACWIGLLVLCLFTVLGVRSFHRGEDLLPVFAIPILWTFVLLFHAIARMHILDALPISRRLQLGQVIVPILVAVALGYGGGELLEQLAPPSTALVRIANGQVTPPNEYREIAWRGQPPEIVSPWGETCRPLAYPLFPGSRIAVYNPFVRGAHNSVEFAAWQTERALTAVHGRASWTVDATPLVSRVDSLGQAQEVCCAIVEESRGQRSASRYRTAAASVLTMALIATGFLVAYMQRHRGKGHPVARKVVATAPIAAIVAVVAGYVLITVTDVVVLWPVGAFAAVLVRKAGDLVPGGTPGLVLVAIAVLLGCYLMVEAVFRRIEAPLHVVKPFMQQH